MTAHDGDSRSPGGMADLSRWPEADALLDQALDLDDAARS
jgi:hypothetical protein